MKMETIALLKTKFKTGANARNLRQIAAEMKRRGVCMSWDMNKELMIFYGSKSDKFVPNNHTEHFAECNGLILDFQFLPVVVPKRSPVGTISKSHLKARLNAKQYNIYELHDGTVVNLYCRDGCWKMSSFRGIEINDVVLHQKTWEQLFQESLVAAGYDISNFYAALDVKHVYTLGFSHPESQPFLANFTTKPHPRVWFLQKVQCDDFGFTVRRSFDEVPDFPRQTPVNTALTVEEMFSRLQSAHATYLDTNQPLYGYLLELREMDGLYDPYESVILESDLMTLIRKIFYDKHLMDAARRLRVPIKMFTEWYSYLDATRTSYYLSLVDEKQRFQLGNLDVWFKQLSKAILARINQKVKVLQRTPKEEAADPVSQSFRILVECVREHLTASKYNEAVGEGLVHSVLRQPKYIEPILHHFTNHVHAGQ